MGNDFLLTKNLFFHATNAAMISNKINKDNPVARSDFSDINPIREGPVKKPINPPVVTMAKPSTVLTPGILADALNNTGTIQQQPKPIKIYPAMAIATTGDKTTMRKPVAPMIAPVITTLLLPNLVIISSPFNLPRVIAAENPA